MFKKSQLALILLTLVLMLSVYYIKTTPKGDDVDTPPVSSGDDNTNTRLEPLTVMRTTLKEERNTQIASLNQIIASSASTAIEISKAMDEKNKINALTEKELLLELAIIQMGYKDAFVHATNSSITVTVVSEEHSVEKANAIIVSTILGFDSMTNNVSVEFQTAQEVMGKTN